MTDEERDEDEASCDFCRIEGKPLETFGADIGIGTRLCELCASTVTGRGENPATLRTMILLTWRVLDAIAAKREDA